MPLHAEFYRKKLWKPEQFEGSLLIDAGQFRTIRFLHPTHIRAFVSWRDNLATLQFDDSEGLMATRYAGEDDGKGRELLLEKPIHLYPNQELYLMRRVSWKENKSIVFWMSSQGLFSEHQTVVTLDDFLDKKG